MDFEAIKRNLLDAFSQLCALRLIISSPHEKAADLPALYVIMAVLLSPYLCVFLLVLGFILRYGARFEKDATRR